MTLRELNVALAMGVVILLSACSGNTIKEKTLKASDIYISGDGSEYIKVVDGDYIMKAVDSKIILSIKMELIKSVEVDKPKMGNLSLIPIDNSGTPVADIGIDFSPAKMGGWGKFADLLKSDVGKVVTISFVWSYFSSKDKQARIMEQTENFEITQANITSGSSPYSLVSKTDHGYAEAKSMDKSEVSSESKIWNETLDDYEAYADNYIKFKSKAIKDDNSAMSDDPAMMENGIALQATMAQAQNTKGLNTSQIKSLKKIQSKITTAASKMQNEK